MRNRLIVVSMGICIRFGRHGGSALRCQVLDRQKSINVKFMTFYLFADIETISRPMLFITGSNARSREFREEADKLAGEPKEGDCAERRSR